MTLPDFTAARYPAKKNLDFVASDKRSAFTSGAELGMAFAEWASSEGWSFSHSRQQWYNGYAPLGEQFKSTRALFETYLDTLKQNG